MELMLLSCVIWTYTISGAGRKRHASESLAESSEEVSTAKRRRTFSEGEKPPFLKHQHIKPAGEPSAELSAVKSDNSKTDNKPSESTKPERKSVNGSEQVTGRKGRRRKRSSIQSSGEHESEMAATAAKVAKDATDDAAKSGISRSDAGTGDQNAELKQVSKPLLQSSVEDVNQSAKKQKHGGKLKKEKKGKNKQKTEPPQLRVISKFVLFCVLCILSCCILYFFMCFLNLNSYVHDKCFYLIVFILSLLIYYHYLHHYYNYCCRFSY